MAQAPFDVGRPVHLHAVAGLEIATSPIWLARPDVSVVADIPLRLGAATSADQLQIELKADRQQWCLRATGTGGERASGPLFARLTARGAMSGLMSSSIPGGTENAWAQRWSRSGAPSMFQGGTPVTLTVWVGGPDYVTARAETTISASP